MLVPKKRAAISALLTTSTVGAAARKAKIGSATLWRWLGEPEFRQELRIAQDHLIWQATLQLQRRAAIAIRQLTKELTSKKPSQGRIMAAREILSFGLKYNEAATLRHRLDELQAQVDAMTCPQPSPTSDASNAS